MKNKNTLTVVSEEGSLNEAFDKEEESVTLRHPPSPCMRQGSSRPLGIRRFKSGLDFVLDMATVAPESPSLRRKGLSVMESSENVVQTLHQAARDGDVRVMKYLLDGLGNSARRKINQLDEDLLSPLHYAARYNFFNTVKMLVEKGANVNIQGEGGLTPLHFAARYKKIKIPKLTEDNVDGGTLQQSSGSFTFITDNNNHESTKSYKFRSLTEKHLQKKPFLSRSMRTDSHDSSDSGIGIRENSGVFDALLGSNGGSVIMYLTSQGALVNKQDNSGATPLHYAAMRGNEVAARELLQCKGINAVARDNQEMTPLHLVAIHGSVDIASLLIEAGADIRCKDKNLDTPLHKAAMEGHVAIVELLLEAADLQGGWVTVAQMVSDQDNTQNTALHLAVDNGHRQIVKFLIEKGADVNAPRANFIFPLHLAAVNGDVEIVKMLISENNARIDCLNRDQETPLYRAAEYNQAAVMEYLILKGASIDRKDKDNFTPLLMAACEGHVEALQCLLKHGANTDAVDKNDKTAIFWAADENQLDALAILLKDPRSKELIDRGDRYGNSPLHVAAMKGFLGIVQYLLDQGAQIDHKNEDEQTPLHFAAKCGRTKVVRELLRRNKTIVNDEDEDSNTPLHLAALGGHDKAVQLLLDAGADNEARNSQEWLPLDCAAAKGRFKTVNVLLEADSPIDPPHAFKTTPLHLAASKGHTEVVQQLLEWGAEVDRLDDQGKNCLEVAIENSHKNVAIVILQSEHWIKALSHETVNVKTGMRDTPMRMLIRKLPEVAEKVFYRCTTTNKLPSEHVNFCINFNYEFLDDMAIASLADLSAEQEQISGSKGTIYDEDKMKPLLNFPSEDANTIKMNHPLMIMVQSRRRKLLSHPLCMSLVHLKWSNFGRYIYYINLLFYLMFITFLTGYVLTSTPPTVVIATESSSENPGAINTTDTSSNDTCPEVPDDIDHPTIFGIIGKVVIMVLSIFNLSRELFQLYQVRRYYFTFENLLEWTCYVSSLLLVLDFTECSAITGVREPWQWQLASVCLFLAWIDLMLFVRKFPFLGIYVVMFTYVFQTFVKAFSVLSLILIAFGLGFYTIMQNQEMFETPWKSIVRVITMMLGEYQFDDIFDNDVLAYPIPSYLLFVPFMMLTTMITLNLLVGLAVDDIKEVQEQAELRRLAMQVELVLNVESLLPTFLRKRFIIRKHTVSPNQRKDTFFRRLLDKLAHFEMAKVATIYSEKNEKTDLEKINENQEIMAENVTQMQGIVAQLQSQNNRLESLLMTLVNHKGLHWEDEDSFSVTSAI